MNFYKLTLFISIFFVLPIRAQINTNNALGLRGGDNDGLAFELSYQRHVSDKQNQRLEFGLGWKDSNNLEYLKLIGLYEFVSKLAGDYRWYAGAGGGIGSFKTSLVDDNYGLVAGVIGIEYSEPNLPILFSLDFRPEYGFNNDFSDDIDFDVGLSIRIQF